MDLETAKALAIGEVDRRAGALLELSHEIHAHPELGFEEHRAADLLSRALESEGLEVQRGAYGLNTAFTARGGGPSQGGPTVAVLCEYDALPGIGHACGHNIIAAAGLGAGLAAAAVARAGGIAGQVLILGTPAEEGGGGKILLGQAGAFAGVDAALMVHPAGADLTEMSVIAIAMWEVSYRGRAAHAAASPWKGANGLDAAVLGYNAVAALRQHLAPNERVHGIFTRAGDKPNIVPEHTVAQWYVRSPTLATLEPLKERVLAALAGGSSAAGCEMRWRRLCPDHAQLVTNPPLSALYAANSARLGRPLAEPTAASAIVGSTDMGNVSQWVPSIHPMIRVSPPEVAIHSNEFAAHAAGPDGDRGVLDGAKALAMTVLDLWLRPEAMAEVRAAFVPGP
ncbi:MAG: M20 family metallopeptidase [Acidimicrobiales bacterium]